MNGKRIFNNVWHVAIWPVVIYFAFVILSRAVGTGSNFGDVNSTLNILRQALLTAMIALAMSCNMLNGRWDFSMGIIMVTSSFIVSGIIEKNGGNSFSVLFLCIAVCTGLCMINCILYLIFKIPTLIISFGVLLVYETLELTVNNGTGANLKGMQLTMLGRQPYIYILCIIMFVIFFIIWNYTKFGYDVRSLGNGQIIANNVGVSEVKNIVLSYILCGVYLGTAACINVSMKGNIEASSTFNNNMSMMFIAFPAVFIGLFLSKYVNFVVGVVIGAFCIKLLTQGLLAVGLPNAAQNIGVGVFLFIFIGLTTNQDRIAEMRVRREKAKQQLAAYGLGEKK